MKSLTKTRFMEGSLIITIHSEIVRNEMIKEDELVELEIKKVKRNFLGALKGIGPFTKEDELKGQFE